MNHMLPPKWPGKKGIAAAAMQMLLGDHPNSVAFASDYMKRSRNKMKRGYPGFVGYYNYFTAFNNMKRGKKHG